jgi:isopentenyldiphosphate isomerase
MLKTATKDEYDRLAELYAQLATHAQEAPPELARVLYIADHRCGWVTQAACDALKTLPHIQIEPDALRIGVGLTIGPQLNALLAEIAQVLREQGCLRGWRDELMDITTPDAHLGVIERAAMRPLGLLTRAVHLNAWTPCGQLWVARRSLSKSTDPGMWDSLVGGLVSAQEDVELGLVRECAEEAGLSPDMIDTRTPLRTVLRMHRRLPEGYQVEDLLTSTCVLPEGTVPANQDGEVMEITHLPISEVVEQIIEGEFTLEAALVILEDIMMRRAKGDI